MVGTRRSKRGLVEPPSTSTQGNHNEGEEETVKAKNPKMSTVDKERNFALKIFLNPLLVENIAKHLPTDRLLTLRRTCKLWNKVICSENRKRNVKVIRLYGSSNYLIEQFNKCVGENPFGAYILKDLPFSKSWTNDFLVKIGSVMTHIELELNSNTCLPIAKFRTLLLEQTPALVRLDVKDSRCSAIKFWKNELHPINTSTNAQVELQTLPNLKKIALQIITNNVVHGASDFKLTNQLVNAAINLQFVEINNREFRTNDFKNGILLEALKGKANHLGKLQGIKFSAQLSLLHLQTMVELSSRKSTSNNLQLKKFNLCDLNHECFTDNGLLVLNKYLALQASQLETLNATSLHGNIRIYLPIMNTLKTLDLEAEFTCMGWNGIDDLPKVRFQSLIVHFPNLVNLTVKVLDFSINPTTEESQAIQRRWTAFTNQLGHHNGITTLHLALYGGRSYLQDLSRMFPNVKSLKIDCKSQVFPHVWTLWPRLESLDVEVFEVTKWDDIDSYITGIPADRLKALRESKDVDRPSQNWKELLKTAPGISDLSYLREFKFWIRYAHNTDVYMTDVSGYYGFVANPSLVRIYINRCSNFSPECVSAVEASVGIYGHFVLYDQKSKSIYYVSSRSSRGSTW